MLKRKSLSKKLILVKKFWYEKHLYLYLLTKTGCLLSRWPFATSHPKAFFQHSSFLTVTSSKHASFLLQTTVVITRPALENALGQLVIQIVLQTQDYTALPSAVYTAVYSMLERKAIHKNALFCLQQIAKINGVAILKSVWVQEWEDYFGSFLATEQARTEKFLLWSKIIFFLDYLATYAGLYLAPRFLVLIQQVIV